MPNDRLGGLALSSDLASALGFHGVPVVPGVSVVEQIGPLGEHAADGLTSAERSVISAATPKRQREFATGRAAAKLAAADLGFELGDLLPGEARQPLWPQGLTGSITHTNGYVMAAVATVDHEQPFGLGVDAERVAPLEAGVVRRILTPNELDRLTALSSQDQAREVIRVFSAKEAFYKAQFSLTQTWVGFQAAQTTASSLGYSLQCADHEISELIRWPQQINVIERDGLAIAGLVARPAA